MNQIKKDVERTTRREILRADSVIPLGFSAESIVFAIINDFKVEVFHLCLKFHILK